MMRRSGAAAVGHSSTTTSHTTTTTSHTTSSKPVSQDLAEMDATSLEAHGAHDGPEQALLFLFLSLLIGAATRKLLLELKRKVGIRLPYSVALFIIGGLLGYAEFSGRNAESLEQEDQSLKSLGMWTQLSTVPTLLLFIFLPALIYEACMTTDYFVFSNHLGGSLLLAGPGMAIQVVLIAITGKYMLPYEWGWTESFLFGGILSATDPVAVIGLLKELGVLPDLRVLIEGESVLNDGTAIVVYELCKAVLLRPEATVGAHVATGFRLVLGGPALGAASFLLSNFWLMNIKDPNEETIVTVCSSYLTYFVAEGTSAHVSAVLSIVTLGVLTAGFGRTSISEEAEHTIHAFWNVLCFCSDTIIFVLAGAIIVDVAFLSKQAFFTATDWGYLFALYVVLMLIRGLMVGIVAIYLRHYGYGLDHRVCSWSDFVKNMLVITWGGLRGAVGLVLALAVSADENIRAATSPLYADRCLAYVAGFVVLTLIINATTLELLIKMLGLGQPTAAELKVAEGASRYLEKTRKKRIDELQKASLFPELIQARWSRVSKDTIVHRSKKGVQQSYMEDLMGESNADLEGAGEAHDHKQRQVADAYHRRFLLSLKASYSSQFSHGVIDAAPFRILDWAVNKALLHMRDTESSKISLDRFEWGWLVKAGYVGLGKFERHLWVKKGYNIPFVKRLLSQQIKYYIQIVTAVAKAHSDAADISGDGQGIPYEFDTVIEQSFVVRRMAQAELGKLEGEFVLIAIQNATTTAINLVELSIKEEIETLARLGQLTGPEAQKMEEMYYEEIHHNMAVPLEVNHHLWERVHNVPIFNIVSLQEEDFEFTFSQLHVVPQSFDAGSVLQEEGGDMTGIWIILKGTANVTQKVLSRENVKASKKERDEFKEAVHAGATLNILELMAVDAGYDVAITCTVTAATKVKALHISTDKMQQIVMHQHGHVRQRMWQLYGSDFLLSYSHLFSEPVFISPELDFSSAILRRPAKGVVVKHEIPGLLITGAVQRGAAGGQLVKGIAMIDPYPEDPSIQFAMEKNFLLLFPPEKESKHFADAVVKMLGKNQGLAHQRESIELTRSRASLEMGRGISGLGSPTESRSMSVDRLSSGDKMSGGYSGLAIRIEKSKFHVASMELSRRQLRPSMDAERLCTVYREEALTSPTSRYMLSPPSVSVKSPSQSQSTDKDSNFGFDMADTVAESDVQMVLCEIAEEPEKDHLDRIRSAEGKDYFDHSKIEAETGTVTTMAKQASIDAGNPSSSHGSSDKRAGPPGATSLVNTRSDSGGSTPAKAAEAEPNAGSARNGKE